MYDEKISEVMHLLMAVYIQGNEFYLNQIEEITNFYGKPTVLKAEQNLHKSRAFKIIMEL